MTRPPLLRCKLHSMRTHVVRPPRFARNAQSVFFAQADFPARAQADVQALRQVVATHGIRIGTHNDTAGLSVVSTAPLCPRLPCFHDPLVSTAPLFPRLLVSTAPLFPRLLVSTAPLCPRPLCFHSSLVSTAPLFPRLPCPRPRLQIPIVPESHARRAPGRRLFACHVCARALPCVVAPLGVPLYRAGPASLRHH